MTAMRPRALATSADAQVVQHHSRGFRGDGERRTVARRLRGRHDERTNPVMIGVVIEIARERECLPAPVKNVP